MASRHRFQRGKRIRSRQDFGRIFQLRCTVGNRHLVLFVAPNELDHPRLGLSAGRRLGNAVVRNREKRKVREAFRLVQHELPPIDMICILKARDLTVGDYENHLRRLAGDAQRRLRRLTRDATPEID